MNAAAAAAVHGCGRKPVAVGLATRMCALYSMCVCTPTVGPGRVSGDRKRDGPERYDKVRLKGGLIELPN